MGGVCAGGASAWKILSRRGRERIFPWPRDAPAEVGGNRHGNRKRVATGSGHVELYDVATGKVLEYVCREFTMSTAISPDGKVLATGHGQSVKTWDATTGQAIDVSGWFVSDDPRDPIPIKQDAAAHVSFPFPESRYNRKRFEIQKR